MKNSKNNRTTVMVIILLGLLFVAYKVMFVKPVDEFVNEDEHTLAIQRVESILIKVEGISFDNVNIVSDAKFRSLKSIERPLISLPSGKKNPFAAIFGTN